jgi:hypothetical protein
MESRDTRRAFTTTQKNEILYQQNNKCAKCREDLDPRVAEFDHIEPWAYRGRTVTRNGAALCPNCHRLKTHHDRLQKLDEKETSIKPASTLALKKLSITQLKVLAKNHHIILRGKTVGYVLGAHFVAPTKKQYVDKLSGVVTEKEIRSLSEKP